MKSYRFFSVSLVFVCALTIITLSSVRAQIPEERAKPVLENGVLTLRIDEQLKGEMLGWETRIHITTLGDESAIKIPVVKHNYLRGRSDNMGFLYLTKTRIAYYTQVVEKDSFEFNVSRSEMSLFKREHYREQSVLSPERPASIAVKANSINGGKIVNFYALCLSPGSKDWISPGSKGWNGRFGHVYQDSQVLRLAESAYSNFDSILQQLQQLTAGLLPSKPTPNTVQGNLTTAASGSNRMEQADTKQVLYERFVNNRKTNPDIAYSAAKAYLQAFPDERSDDAEFMKKWIIAYEKVKGRNN